LIKKKGKVKKRDNHQQFRTCSHRYYITSRKTFFCRPCFLNHSTFDVCYIRVTTYRSCRRNLQHKVERRSSSVLYRRDRSDQKQRMPATLVANSSKDLLVGCAFLKLVSDFEAGHSSLWCGTAAPRVGAALHVADLPILISYPI
jgi:hypothetical protein